MSVSFDVSSAEVEVCFAEIAVYRAQKVVLMTFYREAMQDLEASCSDAIDRGPFSVRTTVQYDARREATALSRETLSLFGDGLDSSNDLDPPKGRRGAVHGFSLPTSADEYGVPASQPLGPPLLCVLVLSSPTSWISPSNPLGVRGRR